MSTRKCARLNLSDLSDCNRPSTSYSRHDEYSEYIWIDVSCCHLSILPGAKRFINCTELDISENELTRISSLLPLSHKLIKMNASRNKINNLSGIVSFRCLEQLRLSCNHIINVPILPSTLTLLDISFNKLIDLPQLSSLVHLETLNICGNNISSLSSSSTNLPFSLKALNVSCNKISTLSSFYHLTFLSSLQSLSILPNPCLSSSSFNHRSFIFALFYNSLIEVDGVILTDEEKVVGEQMIQEKLSKLKREGEDKENDLIQYLSIMCPYQTNNSHNSTFDVKLIKVLEKRREYESSRSSSQYVSDHLYESSQSMSLPPSIHSPYSNWSTAVFSMNAQNVNRIESDPSRSTTLRRDEKDCIDSMEVKKPIPKPRMTKNIIYVNSAMKIQLWWRRMKRQKDKINKMNEIKGMNEMIMRLNGIDKKMNLLTQTAQTQVECSERLEEMITTLIMRVNQLELLLTPPPPSDIKLEYGNNEYRLNWKAPPPVHSYELYVDGKLEAKLNGRSTSCLFSSLSPTSCIQLRSVTGYLSSKLSKHVTL